MENEIVRLEHVYYSYKNDDTIIDCCFSISNKDYIAIMGPNGGGKTTLLKLIIGLLSPDKGKVKYNSVNLCNGKDDIGYVPQYSSFDKTFPIRVIDVVLMGLLSNKTIFRKYSKSEISKAKEALERMSMLKYEDKHIDELSGGQMQRVLIARGIVNQPKLLLLDEPTNFVDKTIKESLNDYFDQLNKDIAIVLVTHDLSFISPSIKQIVCVNKNVYFHDYKEHDLPYESLKKVYGCPIELIAHGVPHRVLKPH